MFSSTVEQEKLVEMKRGKDCKIEEKSGGKGSTEDSELQTIQKEHSPVCQISPPTSPVSSPVSHMSSTGDQVQAMLPSSPPSMQGERLSIAQ